MDNKRVSKITIRVSEDEEQMALFEWAEYIKGLELMFHIPNGSNKSIATAVKFKKMGLKSGVPDIFLPVAREGYHGLFIEMKAKGGRTSDKQDWWLEELSKQGYLAVVAVGFNEAKRIIEGYMK